MRWDGQRFAQVQRPREDPTLNKRFGLQGVVRDDTLRRFVASVPEAEAAAWGWAGGAWAK